MRSRGRPRPTVAPHRAASSDLTSEGRPIPATLVIGSGAIGAFVAARLSLAGRRVKVLTRPGSAGVLTTRPLHLVDDGREVAVRLDITADPGAIGSPDLVLVAVKSFDTARAAAAIAPSLPERAAVLSLQNGVDNPALLSRALPGRPVGAAAVYLGCQRTAPNAIVRRPSRDPRPGAPRDLLWGGGPGPLPEHLRRLAHVLGVPVRATSEPAPALWTKLVANASLNTLTALGRSRVGRLFAHEDAIELMRRIGREVVAVARAGGIAVDPDAADAYVDDARGRLPADGGSSTLFDLEAGRRLEREALIGAVVRHGRRLGVPVPASTVCAALLELADPWQDLDR
jgi:2-dehydropantoate 2-reductase